MTEKTTERMRVAAPPERCYAVITDFEAYPEWVADVKQVEILDTEPGGRASRVRFRAAAFGRSTTYTLDYDYSAAPDEVSWVLQEGDLTTRLDGRYRFDAAGDGETEVSYELSVELKVPIPGFVKRRAEGHIIHAAVRELRARAESLA